MPDEPYRGAWTRVRRVVLERDGWVCQLCGRAIDPHARPRSPESASVDHIVQPMHGGAWHDLENLRACHLRCNSRRGQTQASRRRRYRIVDPW